MTEMRNKAIYIGLFVCLILILPNLVSAQSSSPMFSMEELAIQVMPEYSNHPEDKAVKQPPLLIGFHGTLLNNSDQPQKGKIEIPLPIEAKNFRIGYVADYNRDQTQMNEIEYEVNKEAGTISWITTEEVQPGELYKFVIEFYTDEIKVDKNSKSLSYSFKSFTDIGLVRILFLEPLKANDFRLTPAAESHQENGYGMNMFMYQIQGMKQNDTKEIKLTYQRAETKTTIAIMNEMGNKTPAKGEEKKNETLPMGVMVGGIGGITTVLAILLLFFLKRKPKIAAAEVGQVDFDSEDVQLKKKRMRGMLIEGSISVDEYEELLKKLEDPN
jgi:hypothetical protein